MSLEDMKEEKNCNKKIFMVNTRHIQMIGYKDHMANAMGKYIDCWYPNDDFPYDTKIIPLDLYIPFQRTKNTDKEEYIEMITGTLFYREDDEFYTEDSYVCFEERAVIKYDNETLYDLCREQKIFILRQKMKWVYMKNRRFQEKEKENISEKGAKILSKLQKKHKDKL